MAYILMALCRAEDFFPVVDLTVAMIDRLSTLNQRIFELKSFNGTKSQSSRSTIVERILSIK